MIPDRFVLRPHARKEFVSHHRRRKATNGSKVYQRRQSIVEYIIANAVTQHIDNNNQNMYSTILSQWRDTSCIGLAKPPTTDFFVACGDSQTPIAQQNAMAQPRECDAYAESWSSRRLASLDQANRTKAIAILGHQRIHQRPWTDRLHS